ncbi:MAG: hypothetical protein J6A08_00170 [Lachnospiraceae bacterium]|nr:hypothetical protein [Lachnospiraceae bacterium]
MKCTIVGIKKGKTKNGKECYNYYGVKDFSDYDRENSECQGQEPVSAFSYKDYSVMVGDVVDFRYEPGFEGRATLEDIVMVEPAGKTPFDNAEGKTKGK